MQNSLSGRVLTGTITSSNGIFNNLEGYQFITKFTATSFVTQNSSGKTESCGNYTYKDDKIILHSTHGMHVDENLEIKLKFLENNNGVYEARYIPTSNYVLQMAGIQHGIFNLK